MKKKVSILIPCYNEEQTLPQLYAQLVQLMDSDNNHEWEIMFVNDGSNDGTLALLQQLQRQDQRVNYLDLSRNFGKENAMLAGFDHVTGDCMVIMDADLQHPPTLIPTMIEWWEQGYDDVYAKRASRGKESWLRKRLSLLFYKLLQTSSRFTMLANVGDFRLLDRCCINALKRMRESERYTKGMYCWIGFKKKEVTFEQGDRAAGQSSWTYRSLFSLALDGITSFSTLPLRISTIMGCIISVGALLYMLYIFITALLWGDPVQGFPTLAVIILFLGGIQLLSLGVIGEYIGRIYNETKNRPDYIVREHNNQRV